jgi:Na+-transporting methylmalonyl-CoA/oxaloacetate decarboxylase beta subunit
VSASKSKVKPVPVSPIIQPVVSKTVAAPAERGISKQAIAKLTQHSFNFKISSPFLKLRFVLMNQNVLFVEKLKKIVGNSLS